MTRSLFEIVLLLAAASCPGIAATQDAAADESAAQSEPKDEANSDANAEDPNTDLEQCFVVPGLIDMSVLSDQHVYIRTRGNNHYLLTTALCEDLQRSYYRDTTRLVPYGRSVCQGDGSYLVYESRARELPCAILSIERIRNRSEARAIARSERPQVDVEAVDPAE